MNNEVEQKGIKRELKKIKKIYGQELTDFCEHYFRKVLTIQEGLLLQILSSNFAPNSYLLNDFKKYQLKPYIKNMISEYTLKTLGYDIYAYEKKDIEKSVKELLEEEGYDFHECVTDGENIHSPTDIQYYRKFYRPGEALCTISNGGRLKKSRVFWIVRKNADKIVPSEHPRREDDYGVSVLSIQFERVTDDVEIICRYNHNGVAAPNSTYENNLEKIAPGLTKAFEREYGFQSIKDIATKILTEDDILQCGYRKDNTGKYHKVNNTIHGISYCVNNTIIDRDGNTIVLDRTKYVLMDYFIFDKVKKIIYPYDSTIKDAFLDGLSDLSGVKIDEVKDKNTGERIITLELLDKEKIVNTIDDRGRIIEYENKNLTSIDQTFLYHNDVIENINIPNQIIVNKNQSYHFSTVLKKKYAHGNDGKIYQFSYEKNGFYYCPNHIMIDNKGNVIHLDENRYIIVDYFVIDKFEKKIYPYDDRINDSFCDMFNGLSDEERKNINIIQTTDGKVGTIIIQQPGKENIVIKTNEFGQIISYDNRNIKEIGDNFLKDNKTIEDIYLPNVRTIGNYFCSRCDNLKSVNVPNTREIEYNFCARCNHLTNVNVSNVKKIGDNFCTRCTSLTSVDVPNAIEIGDNFCHVCSNLTSVDAPNVKKIGECFCGGCSRLTNVNAHQVETIGIGFCGYCSNLVSVDVSSAIEIGNLFCDSCDSLTNVDVSNAKTIGDEFCSICSNLTSVDASNAIEIGNLFCDSCDSLTNVDVSNVRKIGFCFCLGCNSLTSIVVSKAKTIGGFFCARCSRLTSVDLSNECEIEDGFCYECNSLTNINSSNVMTKKRKRIAKKINSDV